MKGLINYTSGSDACALARRRALLDSAITRHADRLLRVAAGTASPATLRALNRNRAYGAILEARQPVRRKQRGFVSVAVCVVFAIVGAGILADTAGMMRVAREGCAAIFQDYDAATDAGRRIEAARLHRVISRNYCERGQDAE